MLRDNIRASDLVVGDMEAQVAARRIGAERMLALIARYGSADCFEAACAAVMDSVRAADAPSDRRAAGRRPGSAETMIDGFLDDPDPARRELPLVATRHRSRATS